MREKIRNTPVIPDHEVLRKIGGGAYGDVWMARTVTGMMRAVKVVWRSDFDTDEEFEREFEGIKKYEPISRDHPGLIPILHVGRSKRDKGSFYYYVMELADDQERGQSFHPVEYTPRTLRSDLLSSKNHPINVDDCIEVGKNTAEALEFLHSQGLAHRDIKPANIVYHSGKPKLADIGLVAIPGQMTYVGTQGFVPPEGPGTRRADIYALGKILYEMTTGKDRMDFPALPECPFKAEKASRWRALNEILCDVCDPREQERTIKTAEVLCHALGKIAIGKKYRPPRRWKKPLITLVAMIALASVGVMLWQSQRTPSDPGTAEVDKKIIVPIKITSTPVGAEVWTTHGVMLGKTPLPLMEAEVGTIKEYEFRLEGYATIRQVHEVKSADVFNTILPVFSPPEDDKPWSDFLGVVYLPKNGQHVSQVHIPYWAVNRFLKSENVKGLKIAAAKKRSRPQVQLALADKTAAEAYCSWLTNRSIKGGYLTDEYEIVPEFVSGIDTLEGKAEGLLPFKLIVKKIPFATLKVKLESVVDLAFAIDGVLVDHQVIDGEVVVPQILPGRRLIVIEPEGYRRFSRRIVFSHNEVKELKLELQASNSVIFGQSWQNSLGMTFEPIGSLMVSAHETTMKNYFQFCQVTKRSKPKSPDFPTNEDYPVVYVSRKDAMDFCAWLTRKERKEFRIGRSHYYRLPTDSEWSFIAGMEEENGDTPFERERSESALFSWGENWLPEDRSENLADANSVSFQENKSAGRIHDYYDDHEYLARVGNYPGNKFSIYDIGGNVSEWVQTDYGLGDEGYGVVRGGSWLSYQRESLLLKFRGVQKPDTKSNEIGFRVVLSKSE